MPSFVLLPETVAVLRDSGWVLLAWLLGGSIGWQREARGHAAGLRTHALVCVGSCLLSLLSFSGAGGDKGRIAAQIVTGIGFLGAGVIFRRGASVRGLTTAATVWVVAGIGIAVGAGLHFALLAVLTTMLTLVTLALEGLKIARKQSEKTVLTATRIRKPQPPL